MFKDAFNSHKGDIIPLLSPLGKEQGPWFHLLHQRMLWSKFGWYWLSGSWEENENKNQTWHMASLGEGNLHIGQPQALSAHGWMTASHYPWTEYSSLWLFVIPLVCNMALKQFKQHTNSEKWHFTIKRIKTLSSNQFITVHYKTCFREILLDNIIWVTVIIHKDFAFSRFINKTM